MTDPSALKKAIDNLSKKQHVVSDEARLAKANQSSSDYAPLVKTNVLIRELNRSVQLLTGIFRYSGFDDIAMLLSRPFSLFFLQVCIGFVRGFSFIFGALGCVVMILFISKHHISPHFISAVHHFFTAFNN